MPPVGLRQLQPPVKLANCNERIILLILDGIEIVTYQNPIEGARSATSLRMSQRRDPRIEAQSISQNVLDVFSTNRI